MVLLYVPAHDPGVVTSDTTLTVALLHASLAVGGVNTGVAGQLIVVLAPAAEIVGGVTSCTVIAWDAVAVKPAASVAVQVLFTL
jgi:hypothetical protein